jgi:hypothetical protein
MVVGAGRRHAQPMTKDDRTTTQHVPGTSTDQSPLHRPAGTGATYLGPGDVYRFLVTGAETGGAYFAMEAIVQWITVGVGDFINVPRGTVHRFHNQGTETMRMILTFTPAGIENFFQETLQPTLGPTADIPDNVDAVAARYATAAPRYGIQFLTE